MWNGHLWNSRIIYYRYEQLGGCTSITHSHHRTLGVNGRAPWFEKRSPDPPKNLCGQESDFRSHHLALQQDCHKNCGKTRKSPGSSYPLVNYHIAMKNHIFFCGIKTHDISTQPCSIAMLVICRGSISHSWSIESLYIPLSHYRIPLNTIQNHQNTI